MNLHVAYVLAALPGVLAVAQFLRWARTRDRPDLVAAFLLLAVSGACFWMSVTVLRIRPQLDLTNSAGVPVVVRTSEFHRRVEPGRSVSLRYGLGDSLHIAREAEPPVRAGRDCHPGLTLQLPWAADGARVLAEVRLSASGQLEVPALQPTAASESGNAAPPR